MVKAAYAPPISLLLLMMLVVLAGTAWFAALHPRFVWRMIQGDAADREYAAASEFQRIRLSGLAVGMAALLLLLLTDAA